MDTHSEDLFRKLSPSESFTLPRYDGYSTVNLTSTLLQIFGAQTLPSSPLHIGLVPDGVLDGVKNVVYLVVDALGYRQLKSYVSSGAMPNVEQFIKKASGGAGAFFPLTTVFPSTTAAALTSIYTGLIPLSHGLLSYSVYLPEINDVADLVFSRYFSDGAKIKNYDSFLHERSAFQLLSEVGVRSVSVSDKAFQGSLLSAVHHRGSTFAGYSFPSTIPTLVSNEFHIHDRNFVTIYWPGVDSCAHKYGPMSDECKDEAYVVDTILGRIVDKLKMIKGSLDDTLFVLTADHGQVLNDESHALQLNSYPELLSMLRVPPSGERRSLYLYPKEGYEEAVIRFAEEKGARVMSREEALKSGLYGSGPAKPSHLERIGELIVLPPGTAQWIYDPENGHPVRFFKGAHGGVHSDEMIVPCLLVRC